MIAHRPVHAVGPHQRGLVCLPAWSLGLAPCPRFEPCFVFFTPLSAVTFPVHRSDRVYSAAPPRALRRPRHFHALHATPELPRPFRPSTHTLTNSHTFTHQPTHTAPHHISPPRFFVWFSRVHLLIVNQPARERRRENDPVRRSNLKKGISPPHHHRQFKRPEPS